MSTLLGAIAYTGSGGASGQMTSAHLGNSTYAYSASFDALARPTDLTTTRISDGATLFEEAPSYDAAGNISGETTTLPTGTDVQAFCYDEQNRLTWAGSTGTPPCTGTAISSGTLSSAQYTQTFSYDTLNRLTSGPLGSYSYGDAAHLHAATSVGTGSSQYTAAYDASGNMTCRAPDSSTTCSGTQTGQQLTWDNEGRLTAWQNAPSSPTSTDQYLYDGQGNRVEQQVTSGGTTTTTVYVGSLESVATTGGISTTTTYYYADGQRIALAVNGTLSYLASDLLGSATEALDGSGTPTASQLYTPYGSLRYSSGAMPTDYGFTGQRADSATGLDYYGARYYDPTVGQFTSADTMLAGGLNRYGYVGGNPISHSDPSGHRDEEMPDGYGDGGEAPGDGTGDGVEGGGDGTGPAVNTTTTIPQDDVSPDYIEVVNADGSITWEPTNLTEQDLEDAKRADENTRHPETTSDDQLVTVDGTPEFNQSNAPRANETTPETPDNPNTPQTPNQPGNPGTTVSSTPSGTTVTMGTPDAPPYFQSTLSTDGTTYTLQNAYRGNLPAHASDVFAEQFELAGGEAAQLQQLILENVEEEETEMMWQEWGFISGSPLDKMAQNFANSIGVQLGSPSWIPGPMLPSILYPVLP